MTERITYQCMSMTVVPQEVISASFLVVTENNAATAGISPETDGVFVVKIYKPLPSKKERHCVSFVS